MSFAHDFLKPHYKPEKREIGFRIGRPVLSHAIKREQKSQRLKWTRYNEVEARNFKLRGISGSGINISFDVRWKKFTDLPFTGRRHKLSETNCDIRSSVRFVVTKKRKIAMKKPTVVVKKCTDSGWTLGTIVNSFTKAATWLFSGGKTSFGLIEIFANLGGIPFNFGAVLSSKKFALSDPVQSKILLKTNVPFVDKLYGLDKKYVDFYLHDLRYDAKGMWIIFSWNSNLDDRVKKVAGIINK